MTRASITIEGRADRDKAIRWIEAAPVGCRIEFKAEKRSIDQNSAMWAMLTDVSKSVVWHGRKLTPTDWKDVFTASLKRAQIVPNIDGDGFVQIGLHTSDLTKEEMSNLLELIGAFGAQHNVPFKDSNPPPTSTADAPAVSDAVSSSVDAAGATNSPGDHLPVGQREGRLSERLPAPVAGAAVSAEYLERPRQPTLAPNFSSDGVPGNTPDDHGGGAGPGISQTGEDSGNDQTPPLRVDEASILPPTWQEDYLRAMARVSSKPESLKKRHTEALGIINAAPNEDEKEWMRAVYKLTERRLRGEITREDFDEAVRQL